MARTKQRRMPRPQADEKPFVHEKTFPFEKLPPELRNTIYELALSHTGPVRITYARLRKTRPVSEVYGEVEGPLTPLRGASGARAIAGMTAVGMLLANRMIHKEATPVLYGQNIFAFATDEAFDVFAVTSRSGMRFVRTVRLLCSHGRVGSFNIRRLPLFGISQATSLKHIEWMLYGYGKESWKEVKVSIRTFLQLTAHAVEQGRQQYDKIRFQNGGFYSDVPEVTFEKCLRDFKVEMEIEFIKAGLLLPKG